MEKRKVTLYVESMFGFVRYEASAVEMEIRPYAQHPRAVHVKFIPKGARKPRGFAKYPFGSNGAPGRGGVGVVMLEGWGHPEKMVDVFKASTLGGEVTRYASCDPRWATEFSEAFDSYVSNTGATVLADYRKEV